MPAALAKAETILEAARTGARPLTARQIHALAGRWYLRTLEAWEASPEKATEWDHWEETWPATFCEPGEEDDSDDPNERHAWDQFITSLMPLATEVLAGEGVSTDSESKRHLARVLCSRLAKARAVMARRRAGDYRPDLLAETFPAWDQSATRAADGAPVVTLQALLKSWRTITVTKPRTVAEVGYAIQGLETFLGHGDASRITREDLTRWRDAMKASGKTNTTWNNRLSLVRQVLQHGVKERLLKGDITEGLRLRKNKPKSPLPYSDAEAATILLAARREAKPSLRWAHWVMAFSGMRAAEVLQLTGGDVQREGDVWFLDVHEDSDANSVKTGQRRKVPIHPALITEGFIEYASSVAAKAPLFPDKKRDAFGKQGGRAWNVIGKWVRKTVGIIDPQKAPDHSWRHRMEDELRAAEVPEDARDAILGHSRKTTGRVYGVRGEALSRLHRCLSKVPVPAGVSVNVAEDTAA